MKIFFYPSLTLLVIINFSCNNKDVEPTKSEQFISLLKSKSWTMSHYSLTLTCNMIPYHPFEPIGEDLYFCSGVTDNTTACLSYKGCETVLSWKSYTANFEDHQLAATLKTDIFWVEIDEEACRHTGFKYKEELTDHFLEGFHFDEAEETMTVNFGNIWNSDMDDGFFNIKYKVKTWNEKKIELSGVKADEECFYSSDIVLE